MTWQSSSWKSARALFRPWPPAPMMATLTLSLGRDEARPAEDVPGHDGEAGRGGRGGRDEALVVDTRSSVHRAILLARSV